MMHEVSARRSLCFCLFFLVLVFLPTLVLSAGFKSGAFNAYSKFSNNHSDKSDGSDPSMCGGDCENSNVNVPLSERASVTWRLLAEAGIKFLQLMEETDDLTEHLARIPSPILIALWIEESNSNKATQADIVEDQIGIIKTRDGEIFKLDEDW